MRNLLKIEFSRLFSNFWFKIALLFGFIVATVQFVLGTLPTVMQIDDILDLKITATFPYSLYNSWIGGDGVNIYGYIYFLVLPLLATVAFADSFYKDKNNGYIKSVFARTKRTNYLVAKYTVSFIGGGMVIVLPLIYNFLLTACVLPMHIPQSADGIFSLSVTSTISTLFFSHPNIYLLIYGVIIFVYSGLYATISLIIPFYYSSHFSALVAPFFIHIFLYSFFSMFFNGFYAPFWFIQPSSGFVPISVICIVAVAVFAITFIWFVKEGKRADVY